MGLWSFVKDAGKSLFAGKAEAATVPDEAALKQEVADLGLDSSGLDIKVEGDKVVVTGAAVSPEIKEKIILAVGNVEGVAAVEADHDGDAAPVFHTVVKGDTLSAIAKKTLGNANRYPEIFEANKPMLTHPDKIYPGQVLRIPRA
ncbi:MAG: peptidoglycan-binding protein LysM [Rhodobacterales bacterium]|nr:peptidoglycan-binding protein LysM [Rhodobacterales bacterium]MDX5501043.1 peptidoglycan-binding protein LysM [Rhodobacterales bacterium]